MENNDNLMRLLDALDHPENYTDDELQRLLQDDELRATYELMSHTSSAHEYQQTSDKLPDEELDRQWDHIAHHSATAPRRRYRMAAAVAGILLVSGIALAAIHIVRTTRHSSPAPAPQTVTTTTLHSDTLKPAAQDSLPAGEGRGESSPHQYDNTSLLDIVHDMGEYYHVRVACHNDEAARLRLRFLWERSQSVEQAVETLNTFDHVELTFADSTITIQ
ncbi:MAG: DUF4974 domain-containing protein [Prevotella sp.]|nr:DUF4974 domain-containing protein [Prevotella sp.]